MEKTQLPIICNIVYFFQKILLKTLKTFQKLYLKHNNITYYILIKHTCILLGYTCLFN